MPFYTLAKTNELEDGFKRVVKLPNLNVLVFYHQGEVHVIEDRCPHMDVPLATGTVEANTIRCRAHGIGFDLTTGQADGIWGDTLACLRRFDVVYRDYMVGITLDDDFLHEH